MKHRVFVSICVFTFLCVFANAQNAKLVNNGFEKLDSMTVILDSLAGNIMDIKRIQDSTYQQRMRAIKVIHEKEKNASNTNSEIGVMSEVEKNTRFDFWKNGWNLIGVFALIVAVWSLIIARKTFKAQNETEKHTQKAPKDAQLGVLKDLPRHFYRNLACTCAAHYSFRSQTTRLKYPSEANILKLTTLPDEFILPIDSSNDIEYKKMHEEKLLFKNYNLEVEVAAKHFAIKNISDNSLKNDYDNLLFKPLFLTSRMLELQDMITAGNNFKAVNGVVYAVYAFVKEHFEKVNFNTIIKNDNGEVRLLGDIVNDSDFINKIGVKTNSITRSLEMLLKYKKSDPDVVEFLSRERKNDEFSGEGTVDNTENGFRKCFNEHCKIEGSTKGIEHFQKVLSVHPEDEFANVFNDGKKTIDTSNAYKALSFYFDFMNQESWKVKDLLFTILKIDTVLEIGRIGMIDYQ